MGRSACAGLEWGQSLVVVGEMEMMTESWGSAAYTPHRRQQLARSLGHGDYQWLYMAIFSHVQDHSTPQRPVQRSSLPSTSLPLSFAIQAHRSIRQPSRNHSPVSRSTVRLIVRGVWASRLCLPSLRNIRASRLPRSLVPPMSDHPSGQALSGTT